jgi:hypothetical protein
MKNFLAIFIVLFLIKNASSSSGSGIPVYKDYNCIHCAGGYQYVPYQYNQPNSFYNFGPPQYNQFNSMPPFYPQIHQPPWWAMQGQMTYPNFQYPGMWQNHGIPGHHYPGHHPGGGGGGGMMAMKPNLYLESKSAQKFDLKLNLLNGSTILVAVPMMNKFQWSVDLRDKIFVDDVAYDFLFYDYRLDHRLMQLTSGSCHETKDVVLVMAKMLEKLEFKANEIQDFVDHWPYKIPQEYSRYCLFPQLNTELDRVVKIETTIPATIQRILFLLVPFEKNNSPLFFSKIKKPIADSAHLFKNKAQSNSDEKLIIREWGVAFLTSESL